MLSMQTYAQVLPAIEEHNIEWVAFTEHLKTKWKNGFRMSKDVFHQFYILRVCYLLKIYHFVSKDVCFEFPFSLLYYQYFGLKCT